MNKYNYLFLTLMAFCVFFFVFQTSSHTDLVSDTEPVKINLKKKKSSIPKLQRMSDKVAQNFSMIYDKQTKSIPTERLWQAMNYRNRMWIDEQRNDTLRSAIANVDWVERGPNNIGGRTRALVFDPNDANNRRVVAGSVSGGIWTNNDITDANTSWVKANDFLDNLTIGALAYDPNNSMRIYAGTGEGFAQVSIGNGLYFSVDNGVNWGQVPNTTQFKFINSIIVRNESGGRVIYIASKRIYIGEELGVNGGNNFPGTDGLYRSADDGVTWTQVLPLTGASGNEDPSVEHLEEVNGVLYASTGRNVFGTVDGDVYRCTENCNLVANWTKILDASNEGYNAADRTYFSVSPANTNVIYALGGKNGAGNTDIEYFLKSTNAGTTWNSVTIPSDFDLETCSPTAAHFTRGQATYDLVVKAHPTNANLAFLGGINVLRTTDAMTSIDRISAWYNAGGACNQYVHADQHGVVFRPGSPDEVVFMNDGGVFYSANAGNSAASPTFGSRNKEYNVTQVYSADISPTANEIEYIAGLQDNGVLRLDGNMTGVDVNNGGDGGYVHIDANEQDVQIASYIYNDYSHTDDAWNTGAIDIGPKPQTGRFINPTDYDHINNILYGASNADEISIVLNIGTAGASLVDANSIAGDGLGGEMATTFRVSPNIPTNLYAGNDIGEVFRITNANTAARSSVSISTGLPNGWVSSIDVEKGDENHLLVTLSHYGMESIWESTNGGTSWTSMEGDLPDIPVRWGIFNPYDANQAFIATDLGVWSTDNLAGAATSWGATNSGLANVRVDMLKHRFNDGATRMGDNVVLIAATYGRGIFTTNIINPVLPVELAYFSVEKSNEWSSELSWETSSELDNLGFEIQKKKGNEYQEIGFTAGQGYSSTSQLYEWTDKNPTKGHNYYRLKQLDVDGQYEYSEVKSVYFDELIKSISVSPNPIGIEDLTIQLHNFENAYIQLFNLKGEILLSLENVKTNEVKFSLLDQEKGVYYLRVVEEDFTEGVKIVKL